MKNKIKEYLIILILWLVLFFISWLMSGCNASEYKYDLPDVEIKEFKCIPENYEILFNGEQYAVRIWGIYIFNHQYYNTTEEAIDFCIVHNKELKEHELLYYDDWEVIKTCTNI